MKGGSKWVLPPRARVVKIRFHFKRLDRALEEDPNLVTASIMRIMQLMGKNLENIYFHQ